MAMHTANTNLAYGGYARLPDLSAVGGMAGEATRILLQDVEKRERKRQQNRIAQRNYRRNQKQRIQALEAALGQLEPLDPACTLASPATSSTDTFELPSTSPPTASTMTLQPTNATTSPCDDQSLWALDTPWKPQPQPQLQQSQQQHQPHAQPITPLTPTPTTTDILPTTTPPQPTTSPVSTAGAAAVTPPTAQPPIETTRTPLHLALIHNHTPIIRLLLDRGADPSKPDPHPSSQGSTPLHIAAARGSESLTALLLEKGADVEGRDGKGRTALMRAVMGPGTSRFDGEGACSRCGGNGGNIKDDTLDESKEGNREGVVRLLLEASTDVNARDARGKMALHWAVESGSEGLVLLLLQYGADVEA